MSHYGVEAWVFNWTGSEQEVVLEVPLQPSHSDFVLKLYFLHRSSVLPCSCHNIYLLHSKKIPHSCLEVILF